MKTQIEVIGKMYEVHVAVMQILPSGHGHYKIAILVEYKGNKQTFSVVTNDMKGVDNINDMRQEATYEEVQQAMWNLIEHKIIASISEWIYDGENEN